MSEQKSIQDIRGRVRKVFEGKLKRKVSLTENLQEMGLDSLDTTDIVMQLEDEFGIKIPNEDERKMYPGFYCSESEVGRHQDYATIGEVVDYIQRRLDNPAQSSIQPSAQPATAA